MVSWDSAFSSPSSWSWSLWRESLVAQGTEFRPRILCIVSCTGNQGSKYQNGVLVHVQILGETELGVIDHFPFEMTLPVFAPTSVGIQLVPNAAPSLLYPVNTHPASPLDLSYGYSSFVDT